MKWFLVFMLAASPSLALQLNSNPDLCGSYVEFVKHMDDGGFALDYQIPLREKEYVHEQWTSATTGRFIGIVTEPPTGPEDNQVFCMIYRGDSGKPL